jgi:hypothetical protein
MERLFSPCTRLRDILESQGRHRPPEGLQELYLDVSTEAFLSAKRAFAYADLYAMLENGNTAVWLTPHAFVARQYGSGGLWRTLGGQLDESYRFRFTVDGKDMDTFVRSRENLLEICDVVLRLLAVSVAHSVILRKWSSRDGAWINAPTLAYLMEQCQSLQVLTLQKLGMDENHCRVLGAYSRPELEIVLEDCEISSAGTSALAKVLGSNQGPTKIEYCDIDYPVLADGLRGNSRLKSLSTRVLPGYIEGDDDLEANNREVLAIAGALRENKGLVDLDLGHNFRMSDETWDAVCDSLKTHPTLEVLNLRSTQMFGMGRVAPAALESRIETLLDMMKVNMSIHTIHVDSHPNIDSMRFSESRSFLISRRIGSGRAFLPSRKHARLRTVPRF